MTPNDEGKVMVWGWSYHPFIMGGRCHKPSQLWVEVIEERVMGKGIICFSFLDEKGKLQIADQATRGIVGDSFEQVQKDVDEGDPEVMREQQEKYLQVIKDEGWII
jgi:hypothetical protein